MPCDTFDLIPCPNLDCLCQISIAVYNIVDPVIHIPQIFCNTADNQAENNNRNHKKRNPDKYNVAHRLIYRFHNITGFIITADCADYLHLLIVHRHICRNHGRIFYLLYFVAFYNFSIFKYRL